MTTIENGPIKHPFLNYPLQAFWVFLSGKEIPGRKRFLEPTPMLHLVASLVWMALGAIGSHAALRSGGVNLWLFVPSTLLTVGGARYMVATNIHMCVHGLMFQSKRLNIAMAELFSTVLFVQSYAPYYRDHITLHHGKAFGTFDDSDTKAIFQLGFKAGRTVLDLWINLFRLCLSPVFHYEFLRGRAKENLIHCTGYRRAMTIAWVGVLIALSYFCGIQNVLLVYALPILILYQIASVMHFVCEHLWINAPGLFHRQRHQQLCVGRFCGAPFPVRRASKGGTLHYVMDVVFFAVRTVCIDLPARVCLFQGTLAVHDWHHRNGYHKGWANAAMLREEDVAKQVQEQGATTYREVWGLLQIFDHVFQSISDSAPFSESETARVGSAMRLN